LKVIPFFLYMLGMWHDDTKPSLLEESRFAKAVKSP